MGIAYVGPLGEVEQCRRQGGVTSGDNMGASVTTYDTGYGVNNKKPDTLRSILTVLQ